MLTLYPKIIKAAYEYLCHTPPFSKWKLPPSDEIDFKVTRAKWVRGYATGGTKIGVSNLCVGRTDSLMAVVAHEMIHIHNHQLGFDDSKHGPEFHKFARVVCKVHGFDPSLF